MPSKVTKKKLTVAEAAEQWEKAKLDMQAARPLLEEAAEVLLAHFEKTGRRSYKDRIGLTSPTAQTRLDQEKVRAFLGQRLAEFQKRTTPSPGLTLLEKK